MAALSNIIYVFAVPEWHPTEVTPFQGFAPGLISLLHFSQTLATLPSDIEELSMDPADRLARRRAGLASLLWSPVNVETLVRKRKPIPDYPFMVVFTSDRAVSKRVAKWRRDLRIQPLHIITHQGGGALPITELTIKRLQQHCRLSLQRAQKVKKSLEIDEALRTVDAWRPFEARPTSLKYHSHNVTAPNEMTLLSTGEVAPEGEEGHLNVSPHQEYVDGITESALAVIKIQDSIEDRPVFLLNPPQPDLILVAPASFKGVEAKMGRLALPAPVLSALKTLERQRNYTMEIEMEEGDVKVIGPVLSIRGMELKIQTCAVGLRAVSTLAATIRLPPVINRSAGVIRQLSNHLRRYDDRPPDRKTARVFQLVQKTMLDTIPAEHLALIRDSKTGIKIVGDAPLEWLDIDGLPLGIREDVSRINSTPGNILTEQLRPSQLQYIPAERFTDYLVVSMFDSGDQIADHVRQALKVLPGATAKTITGKVAQPRSVDEFVECINAYKGPILIIDSHGEHPKDTDIGGLIIGGKSVDIWSLRDRLRVPPIIILSACDTHPFDRSHATVANGFLSCGAMAVLASVLPIRAREAAIFLVRLMLRAIEFGAINNKQGRSVAWTNIVGGALRMQLAADIVRGLRERNMLPENGHEIQLSANVDINTPRKDWLERLALKCRDVGGFDETAWKAAYDDILAASDVIRYVHLGNPECIMISDENVVQRAMYESGMRMGNANTSRLISKALPDSARRDALYRN